MKFHEYAEWTDTTSVYLMKNEKMYICLGLISEYGEVIGKLAKFYRGDKTKFETKVAMADELGDVCWFVARIAKNLLDEYDMKNLRLNKSDCVGGFNTLFEDCLYYSKYAHNTALTILMDDSYGLNFFTIQTLLDDLSSLAACLDKDLSEILSQNMVKLESRKMRGKIQGDGDNR
jgi:NTP pyrophosphatase (non-canonical NTP hydrolase)